MKKKTFQVGWKPRSRRADCLLLVLLFILPIFWVEGAWGFESRDLVLENGLRVIMVRESRAPVVVVQVWYRVGAADEVDGKTGLAHMLEHMMFQGTKDVPPGGYGRMVAKLGGENNASTSWDFTDYWSKLSSDQLDLALKLEADRMQNLVFDPERFQSENLVVREERRTRTDSRPQNRFFERFRSFFFENHPYGRPVIGWMQDIAGHTLGDLEAWYRRYYTPDNAVLVIVGDVDFTRGLEAVRSNFGAIKPSGRPHGTKFPEYKQVTARQRRLVEQDKTVMTPVFHVAWPVPSYTSGVADDVHVLDLLAVVLGGGGSSRLYRSVVVEQQVAVAVQAQFSGLSLGIDTFDVYADPRDGVAVDVLEKAIFAEVGALMEAEVSEEELQRAKNSLLADRIYARDSIDHLAAMIGQLTVNGLDWQAMINDFPHKIQSVTAKRLQEVAVRYLAVDHSVVGILTP